MIIRNTIVLILLNWLLIPDVSAQKIIRIDPHQPAILIADAGEDIYFKDSCDVQIGGIPSAAGGTLPYQYQWQPDSLVSDPSISNPYVSLYNPAAFMLSVTDANACSAIDSLRVIAGDKPINSNAANSLITVFPNPSGDFIYISMPESGVYAVSLIDVSGLIVRQSVYHVRSGEIVKINTNDLPSGIYCVSVSAKNSIVTRLIRIEQ